MKIYENSFAHPFQLQRDKSHQFQLIKGEKLFDSRLYVISQSSEQSSITDMCEMLNQKLKWSYKRQLSTVIESIIA